MGTGTPAAGHEVQAVPETEGDALQHGPRRCRRSCASVRPTNAPRASGSGCGRALPGEVRQEQEAVGAGGHLARRGCKVAERLAGRQGVAEPAQRPCRGEHHRHQVPAPGHRVAEGVDAARGLRRAAASVAAKTTSDVPSESAGRPGAHRPDTHGVRRLSPPPAMTGVPARAR